MKPLTLIVALLLITAPVFAQPDACAFADVWMGAVDGVLPDTVQRFDYVVTDGMWNFPKWVSLTGGHLLPNGGILTYGFEWPEGEIITDPALYMEYKERERVEYVIIFCSRAKSAADGKEHDIQVYVRWK